MTTSASPPLLPTPAVNDMGAGKTVEQWDEWRAVMKAKHGNGNGHGPSLHIEALRMLPTVEASRAGGTAEMHRERKRRSMGRTNPTCTNLDLIAADDETEWGKYEPAIRRWEQTTRRAPEPTAPTPRGNRALSPHFAEWMMGAPKGWITDVPGLTRAQQLRLCGNGVVPQQATAAIRWCMAKWETIAEDVA